VEFILDGDSLLLSNNYIERTVQELYQGVGIASACGTILPLQYRDIKEIKKSSGIKKFLDVLPNASISNEESLSHRIMHAITNMYRDVLYLFLQRFVYRGLMVFFGSIISPIGCAVAYRRKYIKDLFDKYEPILGDNLSNSDDIFIGFALDNEGYRNIQILDVYARTQEPEIGNLPHQFYMWSSAYLQCCYYFNGLIMTPFKVIKYVINKRRAAREFEEKIKNLRKIQEPYRQAFGEHITKKYGRLIGWSIFSSAVEKIFFPVALLILILLQAWHYLFLTVFIEIIISQIVLLIIAKERRWSYFIKGLLVTPIRYSVLLFDLVNIGRFSLDLWFLKNRSWRK